jgi:hypothetical protein
MGRSQRNGPNRMRSEDYVVPLGINRGMVKLSVMARKIAVNFVML